MRFLLVYATTEGQTRKIAQYSASRLAAAGEAVELVASRQASSVDPAAFDAVILAGSIHQRRHQNSLEDFVFAHRDQLAAVPTLLISVSLSIAFDNGEEEAKGYVEAFAQNTGFRPGQVALVAGALKFDQYDYYMSQIVDFVVLKDRETITQDREFTDWQSLGAAIDGFAAAVSAGASLSSS